MLISEYRKKNHTFIIAEIAQAHDGSIGILHSMIDAAADCGVDAVKFQIHIADAESSQFEKFRKKFSYVDKTRFDYWKRMEFSYEDLIKIANHCKKKRIEFLATPFSNAAVEMLEKIGVKRYKVGSGDASNLLLLEKIIRTKKEIILSTGLVDDTQLLQSIQFIKKANIPVSILHCTSEYPTPAKSVQLREFCRLKERHKLPTGISDHSGTIFPQLAAMSLGACIVESHITFDKRIFGPDSSSSLTIDQFHSLVEGIRFLEKSLDKANNSVKRMNKEYGVIFGKSLAVNQSLVEGQIIEFHHLEGKKPGNMGMPVSAFEMAIGRKLRVSKKQWDFLYEGDLEEI